MDYKLSIAILSSLLIFASSAEATQKRGVTLQLKASTAKDAAVVEEVELYAKSYALVIGNDAYSGGWPRLSKAVEDAEAIAEALELQGFEVSLRRNLNSSAMKSAFEEFFVVKGENPEARLFVWFAGHGYSENGEGYIIPIDAPSASAGAKFRLKALSLRRFGEYVRQAQSKHAYSVFDSCFSGTIFQTARSAPPPAVTQATIEPVRQFLSSGDAGQEVSDDGNFRRLFIDALAGKRQADANRDGYLTASELGLFLSDRVTNYSNRRQTPRYGKLNDPGFDRGDFVFQLASANSRRSAKPKTKPAIAADREMIFWQSVEDSKDVADYEEYISRFPKGLFVRMAKRRIEALKPATNPKRQVATIVKPKAARPLQLASLPGQELTIVSWGGLYTSSQSQAFHKPFERLTGARISSEDYLGDISEIRRQVNSGNIKWDVVDLDSRTAKDACDEGLLERIPTSVLPSAPDGRSAREDFLPGSLTACTIPNIIWTSVIAYNKDRVGRRVPNSIKDFFDLEAFPGKRGLRKSPKGSMEWALMADGVAPQDIYRALATPAGTERALRRLSTIKHATIWWVAGAQAPQLLADGEVVMASAYNGRIYSAIKNNRGNFGYIWDGHIWDYDTFGILKGSPAKHAALEFIKFATSTKPLGDQANWISYGPARRSSNAYTPTHMRDHLPSFFMDTAIGNDVEFWIEHGDRLNDRFERWLSNG